jgi:hypothetical protein
VWPSVRNEVVGTPHCPHPLPPPHTAHPPHTPNTASTATRPPELTWRWWPHTPCSPPSCAAHPWACLGRDQGAVVVAGATSAPSHLTCHAPPPTQSRPARLISPPLHPAPPSPPGRLAEPPACREGGACAPTPPCPTTQQPPTTNHQLPPTRGARGVQQEQRVLRVHPLHRARAWLRVHLALPPVRRGPGRKRAPPSGHEPPQASRPVAAEPRTARPHAAHMRPTCGCWQPWQQTPAGGTRAPPVERGVMAWWRERVGK